MPHRSHLSPARALGACASEQIGSWRSLDLKRRSKGKTGENKIKYVGKITGLIQELYLEEAGTMTEMKDAMSSRKECRLGIESGCVALACVLRFPALQNGEIIMPV